MAKLTGRYLTLFWQFRRNQLFGSSICFKT